MKLVVKIAVIFLLLFNGIGAFYGGSSLILHSDGSGLGMDVSLLEKSPFTDFLIPGIVLFVVNGIGSFIALVFVFLNHPKRSVLVIGQGLVLCGWIVIQIIMIRQLNPLHYILFSTGALLIFFGWQLGRIKSN